MRIADPDASLFIVEDIMVFTSNEYLKQRLKTLSLWLTDTDSHQGFCFGIVR